MYLKQIEFVSQSKGARAENSHSVHMFTRDPVYVEFTLRNAVL